MGITKSFVLLILASVTSYSQKIPDASGLKWSYLIFKYEQYQKDSIKLEELSNKSDYYFSKGIMDSALFFDRVLLYEASKNYNNEYTALASSNLGHYHKNYGQKDSAFFYYSLSKNLYQKNGDSLNAGKKLLSLALLQKNASDYFGAKETLVEAIVFLEKSGEIKYLASAYNELATNHKKLLNFDDAIYYYIKAISISDNDKDKITYKNNLALVYKEKGEYDKAVQILDEILSEDKIDRNTIEYARIIDNLAYTKWKQKDLDSSPDFLEALSIRQRKKDYRGLLSSHTHLSEFYMDKNPIKAKVHLDSLYLISKRITMPEAELDALLGYMKLEPKNVSYRDRYIFLKDSLYKQELKVSTKFAHIRYLDEQEKLRISQLEKINAEKEAVLAKEKNQKTLLSSLTIILLILGASSVFVLKQRHKRDRLKEIYETEKRISMNLHDNLSGNLFGLIANVQQDRADKESILNELSNIYDATRNISHENGTIETGEIFPNELNALINKYQSKELTVVTTGIHDIVWQNLSEEKCVVIHRALGEMMNNLVKHAAATLASVKFENENFHLKIKYTDNGIGLKHNGNKGLGLKHVRQRVHSVKGTFCIHENQNKGVKMEIFIPIK